MDQKIYAMLDDTGRANAFFMSDMNAHIPTDAREISRDQWTSWLADPEQVMDGAELRRPAPTSASLATLKIALGQDIDAEAERLRQTLITPGSGQAMEYQEAQRQAEAALAGTDAEATAVAYPMLAVTIGIDVDPLTGQPATDIKGVARAIHAAWSLWLAIGSQIRGARLAAKAAVEAATTADAARAARAAVAWPALG